MPKAGKNDAVVQPYPWHLHVVLTVQWCALESKYQRKHRLKPDEERQRQELAARCKIPNENIHQTLADTAFLVTRVTIPPEKYGFVRSALRSVYRLSGAWTDEALNALEGALVFLGADMAKLKRPRAGEEQ